jgi:hypothetical protein
MMDTFLLNEKLLVEVTFELELPSPSSASLRCLMKVEAGEWPDSVFVIVVNSSHMRFHRSVAQAIGVG